MQEKLKLLVIDDEESIRETFKWHFAEQGHEVAVFENPLPMLKNCQPCRLKTEPCCDALFVDHNMPSITGLKFLEQLPDYCKLSSSRIVLMSGSWSDQMRSRAKTLGVATAQKPVSLQALSQLVGQITGASASPLALK